MTENNFNNTEARVIQLFNKVVMSRSDATALVYEDRRITFFELQLYVEWMSGYFQSIHLQPGQRVALLLPNSPKFLISFFGLIRAGGVAVPLDISNQANELRARLMLAKVNAIVTTPEYKPLLDKIFAESNGNGRALPRWSIAIFEEDNISTLNKTIGESPTLVTNDKTVPINSRPIEATPIKPVNGNACLKVPELGYDHPAVIQFKEDRQFFTVTQEDLAREAEAMIDRIQLTGDDRLVCLAPLCQVNCLSNFLVATVAAGATMVLPEENSWESIKRLLVDEHVTILAGPAALLKHLLENPAGISSLRWYFCTDASSPEIDGGLPLKIGFNVGQLTDTISTGISY